MNQDNKKKMNDGCIKLDDEQMENVTGGTETELSFEDFFSSTEFTKELVDDGSGQ